MLQSKNMKLLTEIVAFFESCNSSKTTPTCELLVDHGLFLIQFYQEEFDCNFVITGNLSYVLEFDECVLSVVYKGVVYKTTLKDVHSFVFNKYDLSRLSGEFTWLFTHEFYVETEVGNFIFSSSDYYGGDDTLSRTDKSLKEHLTLSNGGLSFGRWKGRHILLDFSEDMRFVQ